MPAPPSGSTPRLIFGLPNRREVDHTIEFVDVGAEVVVPMRGRARRSACAERHALDAGQRGLAASALALRFNPVGDVGDPPVLRAADCT